MITERLDNPELLETLERAVRVLAAEQGAKLTVTTERNHLSVYVSLPDGCEYSHGHTGFGMSTEQSDSFITHLDVWHDVLVGISFHVFAAEGERCPAHH